MKKYVIILLTLTSICQSQNKDFERVYVEAGLVQPLGILSENLSRLLLLVFGSEVDGLKKIVLILGLIFLFHDRPLQSNSNIGILLWSTSPNILQSIWEPVL